MDEVIKVMREVAAVFRVYERQDRDEAERIMLVRDTSRKAAGLLNRARFDAEMAAKLETTLDRTKDQSHGG